MIKAVLFDLDGTLLPMNQDLFLETYLKLLAKRLAPRGYDPERLISAIWHGSEAMIKNNGETTNEEVFWSAFSSVLGDNVRNDEPYFDEYYRTDFKSVQSVCGYTEQAKATVEYVKSLGLTPILATNPVFPSIATQTRTLWAGISVDDFAYVSTYENSHYSKPNPKYFLEITERCGLSPDECLMVGNDVDDDMIARTLGMKVFLLTDCLINKSGKDISSYPNGGFSELLKYIDKCLCD